jgi:hypothetical protein
LDGKKQIVQQLRKLATAQGTKIDRASKALEDRPNLIIRSDTAPNQCHQLSLSGGLCASTTNWRVKNLDFETLSLFPQPAAGLGMNGAVNCHDGTRHHGFKDSTAEENIVNLSIIHDAHFNQVAPAEVRRRFSQIGA